jgi:hypothetical protein
MSSNNLWHRLKLSLAQVHGLKKTVRMARTAWTQAKVETIGAVTGLLAGDRRRTGPMRGTFSVYEQLKAGHTNGRILMACQTMPKLIPGSLRDQAPLDQLGFQPWPIFWSYHQNAHLVGPSLVLINGRKQGAIEAMFGQVAYQDDPAYRFPFRPPETHLHGNWTSVISRWSSGNIFHWLFDALPRLAVLDELPVDTGILVPPGLKPYEIESLEMLGISDRIRHTTETNLVIENYYFSPPTTMTGCYNPYGVEFLRQKLLPKAARNAEHPKRFYVTRKNKTRGISNEPEVIALFEKLGWAVLDMEGRTLAEQIALFSNATAICALHGAALTNLVWCQPGCKVLELCASTFLNGCYEGVANAVGCDYQFRILPGDSLSRITVPAEEIREIVSGW